MQQHVGRLSIYKLRNIDLQSHVELPWLTSMRDSCDWSMTLIQRLIWLVWLPRLVGLLSWSCRGLKLVVEFETLSSVWLMTVVGWSGQRLWWRGLVLGASVVFGLGSRLICCDWWVSSGGWWMWTGLGICLGKMYLRACLAECISERCSYYILFWLSISRKTLLPAHTVCRHMIKFCRSSYIISNHDILPTFPVGMSIIWTGEKCETD